MKQVNEATDSSDRAATPSQKKRAISGGRVGSERKPCDERMLTNVRELQHAVTNI